MRFQMCVILFVLASSVGFSDDNSDESSAIKEIELFGGIVTKDGTLPGCPVVGVTFSQRFYITHKRFDGKCLPQLKSLKQLKTLILDGREITNASLKEIGELKGLTELSLIETHIKEEQLEQLKKSLPNTKIYDDDCNQSKIIAEIKRYGASCRRDGSIPGRPVVSVSFKYAAPQKRDAFLQKYLGHLKDFKNLLEMDLSGSATEGFGDITGGPEAYIPPAKANLSGLNELKTLTTLVLAYRRVGDDGLKDFIQLPKLTTLNLSGTRITDKGLNELSRLNNLTKLDIHETGITDDGMKTISELNNLILTSLNVSNTRITDEGLKRLHQMTKLTELNLFDTKISDEGMKEVGNLTNLTLLNVSKTKVTDVGMQELRGLKRLTALFLSETQISDVGLKQLRELNNLIYVDLRTNRITDIGLNELKGLKSLKSINGGQTQTTTAGWNELQKSLPNLKYINRY